MTSAPPDDRFALTPITRESAYRHIQRSPFGWMFLAISTASLAALLWSWSQGKFPEKLAPFDGIGVSGWVAFTVGFAFLGLSFQSLLVADEGDVLLVAFGPLRLPRIRIRYADIERIEVGRTTLLDGWGIHGGLRGWVWNIWGRDCVILHRSRGRTLLIGTDEPERLAAFLKARITDSE